MFFQNLRKLVFGPQEHFEEVYNSMSVKWAIGLYFFSMVVGLLASVVQVLGADTSEVSAGYGPIGQGVGLGLVLAGYFAGLVFFVISLGIYSFITKLVLSSQGVNTTYKEILRINLLAYSPLLIVGAFIGVFQLLLAVMVALLPAFTIISSLFSCLILLISLVLFVWFYYILINGYKSMYQIDDGQAFLAGCLPSIVTFGINCVLLTCFYIIFFGALLAAVGSAEALY